MSLVISEGFVPYSRCAELETFVGATEYCVYPRRPVWLAAFKFSDQKFVLSRSQGALRSFGHHAAVSCSRR